jgi:FtsP/CotA-like multicopper oxidase with cupredoxin domain
MKLSRRRVLKALAASALLPGGAGGQPPGHRHGDPVARNPTPTTPVASRPFESPLLLPRAAGLFASIEARGGLRLVARTDRQSLFPGRTTDLMAYRLESPRGPCYNPLLRVRRGEILDVTLANQIGEDTTIHWHGMLVDEKNDGSGMHPVRHGESYVYRFRVTNRAGLYWYHPHPHDRTGAQIHLGMGGLVLLDDEEDERLRRALELEIGRNDIPLILHDKQVDDRNRIRYSMGEDDWIGNRMLVNWTPEPRFEADRGLYRFRILNGSNARTYLLAFTDRGRTLPYDVLGTDGGLLDKPRRVTSAFLGPAQRLDVIVDFDAVPAGGTVMLTSLAYEPMEDDGRPGDPALEHPGAPPMGAAVDLMRIDLKTAFMSRPKLPASLSSMPAAPPASGANVRRFRLHIDGTRWLINGTNYHDDMNAIRERVRRGSREVWEIANDTKSMPHPMHLHGFQFRVLDRRGSPAQVRRLALDPQGRSAHDLGWIDTVLVWPGETVRIAIDFSQPFSGTQRYMFHCHNLEHEDQGMMMNVAVHD